MHPLLAFFFWDPPRFLFVVPIVDRPLGWYGILFALGFIVGYFVMVRVFTREILADGAFAPAHVANWQALRERLQQAMSDTADPLHAIVNKFHLAKASDEAVCRVLREAYDHGALESLLPKIVVPVRDLAFSLTDKLCWCVVAGTVLGARLGHVFFYEWAYYRDHLGDIMKVWEGGLASHGGVIGIILSLFIFNRLGGKILPSLNLVRALDLLAVGTLFACFCIRLGNFFNQEILGTATDLPWGVLFGHPAEPLPFTPRHPVQLYEGLFNLAMFFGLLWVWNRGWHRKREGLIIGILFSSVFAWRFFMEFFKEPLGGFAMAWGLQTGQMLSIPVVLLGLWLIYRGSELGVRQQPH